MPAQRRPSRRGKPYPSVEAVRAAKTGGYVVWTEGTWWDGGTAYWHRKEEAARRRLARMHANAVPAYLVPLSNLDTQERP
jgi:hypothetical protein